MRKPYSLSEKCSMAALVLVCLGIFVGIFLKTQHSTGEQLILAGVWIILSFAFVVAWDGASQGKSRMEVKVPRKPAVAVFSIALVFVAIGAFISVGI